MREHQSAGLYDFSVFRSLRKRMGLTIEEVSKKSGVSPAVISKLERNRSQAELETLFRLARVVGMTPSELLGLAESHTGQVKQKSRHRSGDFDFEQVQFSNVRCLRGRAGAGGKVSRPRVHQDDHEVCWVLEGRILFKLPNETYELASGSALQFDAILEHTYEALEDSEILILHLKKFKRL